MKNTTTAKRKQKAYALSAATIRKYYDAMMAYLAFLCTIDPDNIAAFISPGNNKIGNVLNVSLYPILTCFGCLHADRTCIAWCYALKCLWRLTVLHAWGRNTWLVQHNRPKYFAAIRKAMAERLKELYFRWHVAGEIPDREYFAEMVKIAVEFPAFYIWTYTKCEDWVNEFIKEHGKLPKNLSVMFSRWGVNGPCNNPYGQPEYITVLPGEQPPAGAWHCPGNCDLCKAEYSCDGKCHGCIGGETSWIELHN